MRRGPESWYDERVRRQRAASFGGVVDDYERGRPGYPDDAVKWLVGEPPRDVVDVGAGTGKLTRTLALHGHRVLAVEPAHPMLLALRRAVAVPCAVAKAEALPLRDASVDVVTVAQAFHWFEAPAALGEFARVLRVGGEVGLVWNLRDESVDWVRRLTEIVRSAERIQEEAGKLADVPGFAPVEEATFRNEQPMDAEVLRATVRSRSYVAVLPEDERAAVLGEVEELLRTHPDLVGRDTFVMPYRTFAFRLRRVP